jgi:hypothetical protein
MPAITSATPSRSRPVGTWASTSRPTAVAVAGSSASISANVARGSLAIASWSVTYGTTDEHRPTPTPQASQRRVPERRGGLVQAERGGDDARHQHGRAELVDPASGPPPLLATR